MHPTLDQLPALSPLRWKCPFCGAAPGQPCRTVMSHTDGSLDAGRPYPLSFAHEARRP